MFVSSLSVTPIKGLALHHPPYVDLATSGVLGDRAFFLIDATGQLISCTDEGDLLRYRASYDPGTGRLEVRRPDGSVESRPVALESMVVTDFFGLRTVSGHIVLDWDDFFSDIAGQPLRLVMGQSAGFDVGGVTLLGSRSVSALAEANSANPVAATRFRMNIEFSGGQAHIEDDWQGRLLALGEAVVRVGGPVRRCAATTRNPDTGTVDLQTLRMIGQARGRQETPEFGRGFYFGVYAEVVAPGRVHLGADVSLVD